MDAKQLQDAAMVIRDASAYAYGDPLTFKTPLKRYEAEITAPCDPHAYLQLLASKFGVSIPKGGRVAVIGAGYGGLCGLALMEGAAETLAIEPRFRFKDGLDMVMGLLTKIHGEKIRSYLAWPHADAKSSVGEFDLIFWPEGTEEMTTPVETFKNVMGLLKPGGKLVVEFKTGDNDTLPAGHINSWLPTPEVVAQMLDELEAPSPNVPIPGRMQNRLICVVTAALPEPAPKPVKPAPKSAPKPAPKEEPLVLLPDETPEEESKPE